MLPARPAIAAIPLLLTLLAQRPAHAQIITGRLTDAAAGRPVASAFVQLVDAAGVRHEGALTDSAGWYSLRARAPGEYRLHAQALGYITATSPVLRLGPDPVEYVFELDRRALVLPSVDARSEDSRGCERRPDGEAVVALWDAVRTALTVTAWTGETGSIRYSMMNHTRELDAAQRNIEREERVPVYATTALPYGAVGPEQLARDGYLVTEGDVSWLLGLDADVLLSESFLDSHCFRMVPSRDTTRVGLGFTPLRSDGRTDVSGVLWVNRSTAELQHLEFEFEALPEHMRRFGASGEVHFERLGTGAWIVTRWWIRSPRVSTRPVSRRYQLAGYREDGGTVTSVEVIDPAFHDRHGNGIIEGSVVDTLTGVPAQRVLVFLSGTPFSAVSDSTGRYRITGVPPGTYTIGFTHPLLQEVGLPQQLDTVRVDSATTIQRTFALPTMAELLRTVCPHAPPERTMGLVYGVVRRAETGEPLGGVEVHARWKGQPRSDESNPAAIPRWASLTSPEGRYAICWVPTDRELEVHVATDDVRHRSVKVDLSRSAILRQDFAP
ncbi:MAG TPA: carboxypeptidase regulatory-like domain-containing protein [Longimicrobiales bacterium]|nr:carboxypeptidase regulatory-like domain-containing protein [Longimicrobiales bacterium]